MKRLRAWAVRLMGLFQPRQREQELTAEIESHLQLHIDDNVRSGMTPEAARREAILKLGGIESTKQNCRERRTIPLFENLGHDVRFSMRQLSKNPGFTCTAILTLALGICASVAIYAFVDAALVKPLPYPDPNRLVEVTENTALFPRANLSYPDYLDWKKRNRVFSSLDIYTGTGYLLSTPAGAEPVPAARVSDGFFRTLGIVPALGRDFYAGEDRPGAPNTVILSYGTWQKRFGGRRDVIGQTVTLSGAANTIIGVLPPTFQFAPRGRAEFWAAFHASSSCDLRRSCHGLYGVGRLNDGVSVQTALAEMKSIAKDLERQYPGSNRDQGASVVPLSGVIVGEIRPLLLVLLGGAALLLLIACVNVASLLLVRSESRRREMAIRSALGASRIRLIRQFVTEGLILVMAGSSLGVAAAFWVTQLLTKLIPTEMMAGMPYLSGLGLNFNVAMFAGGVSLLSAILFSVTPMSRVSFAAMHEGMAEGSRGSAASGRSW